MENYSLDKPTPFSKSYRLGQVELTVNFSIKKTTEDNTDLWRYKSATLPLGESGYDAIVNAIVSAEYPADRMQAVVNNYLANPNDDEALEEFAAMQQCRSMAKETAKQVLALL